MFSKLLQFFSFGCRHGHVTQPFTASVSQDYARHTDWEPMATKKAGTMSHYVVCLDCGKKFGYDWAQMRVIWH